jgi:hypothetical protein
LLRDGFAASGKWFRVRCNIAFLEGVRAIATLDKSTGACPARSADFFWIETVQMLALVN